MKSTHLNLRSIVVLHGVAAGLGLAVVMAYTLATGNSIGSMQVNDITTMSGPAGDWLRGITASVGAPEADAGF